MIKNREDYIAARSASRRLQHDMHALQRQLRAQADPASFCSKLAEIASTQRQLEGVREQIHQWEMQSAGTALPGRR